jgi:tetrahydromethanopterin S-methyltransferase subunit G
MNRRQEPQHRLAHNPAYRQAFERLDESLEKNSGFSNAEKIQRLGRQMFGDLWDGPGQNSPVTNLERNHR